MISGAVKEGHLIWAGKTTLGNCYRLIAQATPPKPEFIALATTTLEPCGRMLHMRRRLPVAAASIVGARTAVASRIESSARVHRLRLAARPDKYDPAGCPRLGKQTGTVAGGNFEVEKRVLKALLVFDTKSRALGHPIDN